MRMILLYMISLSSFYSSAQDVHFSQFLSSPLHYNPALAGLNEQGMRLFANYRNQWSGVTAAYTTLSIAADMMFVKGLSDGDLVGTGIMLYRDKAGDTRYGTNQATATFAYHKGLTYYSNHFLSLGFSAGYSQIGMDKSRAVFDDQFNSVDPGSLNPSAEPLSSLQKGYPEFSSGISWFYAPSLKANICVGLSAFHITEPDISLYAGDAMRLSRKYIVYAGGKVTTNVRFSILPSAVLVVQGTHNELVTGAHFNFNLGHELSHKGAGFSVGSFLRWNDAIVAVGRIMYRSLQVGISYDINISGLTIASGASGAPEISLLYDIKLKDLRLHGKKIFCPEF